MTRDTGRPRLTAGTAGLGFTHDAVGWSQSLSEDDARRPFEGTGEATGTIATAAPTTVLWAGRWRGDGEETARRRPVSVTFDAAQLTGLKNPRTGSCKPPVD